MSKTTAPLLSFDARGQIGKTMVYASWKGRPYVRRHVIPSNPQSAEQTLTRNAFSFIQSVYKQAPALATDPWVAYAQGQVMTPRNAFTKFNLPVLRNQANSNNLVLSPGARGGPPPLTVVSTPGNDSLSIAVTPPTVLPQGWTIYSAVAAALRDQDPDTGQYFDIVAGEDLTNPYTIVLALGNALLYQYRAWLKWTRPDGTFAYSPSVGGQSTTT